ncbi:MAG: hypothetical protein HQL94_06790 [Magnetococcales bacterium]|nr:hypothetical protein [Magnetococcales bacterium]
MTSLSGSIPAWNSAGVLPPIRPNAQGNSNDRSPYSVDLSVFVDYFSYISSFERIAILDGLLRFRATLHRAGIVKGFQWLDGSFLEHVESIEGRQPRDMDVVTFFCMPDGKDQHLLLQENSALFNAEHLKSTYRMDAYHVVLGDPTDAWRVRTISYWYSMWSHRRDGLWKGFVQVDLDPSQDRAARARLNLNGGFHHE